MDTVSTTPKARARCLGGDEVGVDWANGLVLHEQDIKWHRWDPAVYEPAEDNK